MKNNINYVESRNAKHKAQRGSIVIPAAAALLVCVILLGAAQLGLYFSVKREAQNAVDLAALSNVVLLDNYQTDMGGQPVSCKPEMLNHVKAYLEQTTSFKDSKVDGLEVECKQVTQIGDEYIDEPSGTNYNAIDVTLNLEAKSYALFSTLGLESINATATAYLPSMDDFLEQQRFSVHYETLGVNSDGLLSTLLRTVGLDTQEISVLTPEGLVKARITPSGLLEALNLPLDLDLDVATPSDLVNLQKIKLADILRASAKVVGQQELVGITETSVLNALSILLKTDKLNFETEVPLFGPQGFLSIADNNSVNAALATRIDWGGFLNTAVLLAQNDTLAELKKDIDLGLVKLSSAVRVIEPPSTAPLILGASASHANARVYLHAIVDLIVLKVDLPIVIEVGQGEAVLKALKYNRVTREGEASFDVRGSLANLCVGDPKYIFSREYACTEDKIVPKHDVIKVLGRGLPIDLNLSLVANRAGEKVDITLDGSGPFKSDPVNTFKLNLSEIVHEAVSGTVGLILGGMSSSSIKKDLPSSGSSLSNLSKKLVGGGAEVPEFTDLDHFNEELEKTGKSLSSYNLSPTLSGLVETLLKSLTTLISDLLSALVCWIPILGNILCPDQPADYEKLLDAFQKGPDERASLFTLTLLNRLLGPLDDILNTVLEGVFKTLGLDVGEVIVRVDEFFSSDYFEGVLIHSKPAVTP